jgi:mannosyltransferase OCH1-like enzyme
LHPLHRAYVLVARDGDVAEGTWWPTVMIPRNLFRTVPVETSKAVETWWEWSVALHMDWECVTYRDPIDRSLFPISSPYWDLCKHGAQMAGLIRLELLYTHGGVYIDSDFQCFRSFGHLRGLQAFAAYEDAHVIPDAVIGAEAGHPAIKDCLDVAILLVQMGRGAWDTGPGVLTDILPRRHDVILFPPAVLYPYHYSMKHKVAAIRGGDWYDKPWTIGMHNWHASWVGKA